MAFRARAEKRPKLPILAFLQNQYFNDPVAMKRIFDKHYGGNRANFVEDFLFYRCQTGKRLEKALNRNESVLADRIVWEDSSDKMGNRASSSFPADPAYMEAAIKLHKPDVIILFGSIAQAGYENIYGTAVLGRIVIRCCHPAARHKTVHKDLDFMALSLKTIAISKGWLK